MRVAVSIVFVVLVTACVVLPFVRFPSAGPAAVRTQSLNNLHNVGIAAQSFATDDEKRLPRGVLRDDAGRALHGWPAQLLPMLDASAVHRLIDFAKPWDHPKNERAMQARLSYFLYPRLPETDENGYGLIHYAANSHVIGDREPLTFDAIVAGDGLATTLLFGEVGGGFRPWGHPQNFRDPALGFGKSATRFGDPTGRNGLVQFVFADGSARPISEDIDPAVLRALATPDGGEEIDPDNDF